MWQWQIASIRQHTSAFVIIRCAYLRRRRLHFSLERIHLRRTSIQMRIKHTSAYVSAPTCAARSCSIAIFCNCSLSCCSVNSNCPAVKVSLSSLPQQHAKALPIPCNTCTSAACASSNSLLRIASASCFSCIRPHTSAYVSIRQHMSTYVSISARVRPCPPIIESAVSRYLDIRKRLLEGPHLLFQRCCALRAAGLLFASAACTAYVILGQHTLEALLRAASSKFGTTLVVNYISCKLGTPALASDHEKAHCAGLICYELCAKRRDLLEAAS